MSDPFVGEIRMFAGNFAPRGWALCDGQLIAVSQNDALFSLLGTIYGGDGRTTFGLPDMRGRIPVNRGSGPGLTPRNIGSRTGDERVTLTTPELASHNHRFQASTNTADTGYPAANVVADTNDTSTYFNAMALPTCLNHLLLRLKYLLVILPQGAGHFAMASCYLSHRTQHYFLSSVQHMVAMGEQRLPCLIYRVVRQCIPVGGQASLNVDWAREVAVQQRYYQLRRYHRIHIP